MYKSVNAGASWYETAPTGTFEDKIWTSTALSSDGLSMLTGIAGERIYRSTPTTPPVIFANITSSSASATGNITATNGADATTRGAILYPYSNTDKIIGDADVVDVNTSGNYSAGTYPVSFSGLTPNIRYNARAHATNTYGTGYGVRGDFWTLASVPLAPTVDNPTATTLDVTVNGGTNSDGTEYAILDSVSTNYVQANGTLADTIVWQTTASWGSVTVTGLTTGTTYYFKVKARNGDHIETAFSPTTSGTPVAKPVATTQAVSLIAAISAAGNGNITATNGEDASNRGIILYPYTNTDKEIGGIDVSNFDETGTFGTGTFTFTLTPLTVNTRYNVRAHATNTYGTGYGARVGFWTLANTPSAPTVINPTATSLDVAVNVNSNPTATEFAIQDSVNGTYVQANGTRAATAVWQTTAVWDTITLTGLTTGVDYYFRVKAKNGDDIETAFSTSSSAYPYAKAAVSTLAAGNISTMLAMGNGNITSITGDTVTVRGLINYAYTGTDKLIADADVTMKADTGSYDTGLYNKQFTELQVNSQYSHRAFAENAAGISYGNRIDFYTYANAPAPPVVINPAATSLDVAISSDDNPAITEYAIQDSVNGTYAQAGGTMGATVVWQTAAVWDTITVTGLSTGVTYYFRVKAMNGDDVETDFGYTTAQNTCSNPTDGGEIDGDQTICYNTEAALLGSISEASDYGGTLEYQWQGNTTSSTITFDDIIGAGSNTYTPGALTQTSWYRRLARVSCKDDWTGAAVSNVVKITIDPLPEATAGGSTTICVSSEANVSGAGSANGDIVWTSNGSGSITAETSLSPTYTPAAGDAGNTVILTMTVTSNNTCGTSTATATYTVYVDPLTVAGTISGNDSTIVHTSTGDLTLSGQTGDVLQWEKRLNEGEWETIPVTATNYSETPVTVGEWYYRALVQSGVCSSTYTADYIVNVIPDVPDYFTLTSPGTATAGAASGNFVIALFDQYDNPTYCRANTTFNLSTNSTSSSHSFNPASPLMMTTDTYSSTFTYTDTRVGTFNITASYGSGSAGLSGESLTVTITIILPEPWVHANIGASNGTTEFFPENNAGTFQMTAQGLSMPKSDVMNYVYQPLCGTGTVIARLDDSQNGGWAGVMMRESNAPGSKAVLFKTKLYNPSVIIGYRATTNAKMVNLSQTIPSIHWMKIQRSGNTFQIFTSYNGTVWNRRYTTTVVMPDCIEAGIFTESIQTNRTVTSWFDHAEVVGYLKAGEDEISEIRTDETFEISFYPNPANDQITILAPDNSKNIRVTLINASGSVVETDEFNTMDAIYNLQHIKPGIYLLRFERDGLIVNKRLIVM
jgi:hypothetical protein